ncbi:sigma factor-like helix-turn-helix DNA-binding protein [Actinoplanes sp. NPDC051494]|uniref:sigma factor-like helix-turn-helix DNA-binding protein n=1 Tax=Actinoplanes sp. NPDC051494 TaxID=3363907 RepID=UPI0037945F16
MRDTAFRAYFDVHHASFARLAYLMTGDASTADDLAGDAFAEIWRRWEHASRERDPAGYGRAVVLGLARRRVPRGLLRLLRRGPAADVPGALLRLPHRRRACVVLRYAFDLSEREIAGILGTSVTAVRAEITRGARQLGDLLGGDLTAVDGWGTAR